MKTTFQTAREENEMRRIILGQYCPCGRRAIKRDGASYVCEICIERDKVAMEMLEYIHRERGHKRLDAQQAAVAKERKRVLRWRREKARQVDITPLSEGAVASSGV